MYFRNAATRSKESRSWPDGGPGGAGVAGSGTSQTLKRGRNPRMWVAALSVVSLLLLGASPALATDDNPTAEGAETVAPMIDGTGTGANPQGTPPTEPIVEGSPTPPVDASVSVPPGPTNQPTSTESDSGVPGETGGASVSAAPVTGDTNGVPEGNDKAIAPTSGLMAVTPTPAPPYLRWVVVDSEGANVAATKFTVQGPRDDSVTDKKGDKQWLGGILATVADNIGEAGYTGADLDPAPGAFLVKTLTADSDVTGTKVVAADEHYRVRPAEATGSLVGEAAQWVVSDVVAELPEPEPTKVTLQADPAATQDASVPENEGSLADDPIIASIAGPEQPGVNTPYLYWSVKDTADSLVGGASFQIAQADSSGSFVLAVTTITDCVAADVSNCAGADKDPDAGEFQVFDLGSSLDTPVATTGRYKLTTQTPPAGTRFPVILPVTFTMNGNGGTPAVGVWPVVSPVYNFGTLQLTKVGPEPGITSPYLYWTTKSTTGLLIGGSSYTLSGASSTGVFGSTITVTDCQAMPCSGADKDPDTGEFQVNRIGVGMDVPVAAGARYQLTPTTPLPSGWGWHATAIQKTIAGSGNVANPIWPAANYDFGNFQLTELAVTGYMPVVVRSRVVMNVPLAKSTGSPSAGGTVVNNLGTDALATDATGTVFRLYSTLGSTNDTRYANGPQQPITAPWASCTTGGTNPAGGTFPAGACTINIPVTTSNSGIRYWVVEEVAPAGTYSNPSLLIGSYQGPTIVVRTVGITIPVAAKSQGTNIYMPATARDTVTNAGVSNSTKIATSSNDSQLPVSGSGAQPTPDADLAGSFGAVPNSIINPRITPRCDVPVTVGLVLDQSASISADDWKRYRQVLVGGQITIDGNTSNVPFSESVVGVLKAAGAKATILGFGTNTSSPNGWHLGPNPVDLTTQSQATLEGTIPTSRPGGTDNATNWQSALSTMANNNSSAHYDLVLFITDGAPNYILNGSESNQPSGTSVSLRSLESAIYSANALKLGYTQGGVTKGTRLVAVGVGAGVSNGDQNLRAISGTVKYAGPGSGSSDYYQNASWGTDLRERLAGIVKSMTCVVSVEVSKTTISATNVTSDNVANWRFTAGGVAAGTGSPPGTAPDATSPWLSIPLTKTTAVTAAGNPKWDLKLRTPTQQASITLTENGLVSGGSASMAGWTLESVACTVGGQPVTVTPNPDRTITLSGITVESESVYCKFTNREQPVAGSIRWQKVSNDTPAEHLAESVWSVQGPFSGSNPSGATPTFPVTDCVLVAPNECTGADKDERAGYLELTELALGKYRVTETSPPPGFTAPVSPAFYDVEITAANAPVGVSFGPVVNVRTLGTVTWGKVNGSGQRLAGSEWQLQGPLTGTPPAGGQTIAVVDCISGTCSATRDKDNRPGYFSVTGLAWGSWTLTETRAPAGYALDSTSHSFSITAAATTYTFSNTFVNVAVVGPNLPLTGGLGRDFFALLGGGVLIFGLGTVLVLQLRKRRREVA